MNGAPLIMNESVLVMNGAPLVMLESTRLMNELTLVMNESTLVMNESTPVMNESTLVMSFVLSGFQRPTPSKLVEPEQVDCAVWVVTIAAASSAGCPTIEAF